MSWIGFRVAKLRYIRGYSGGGTVQVTLAMVLIADRGYHAHSFCNALIAQNIQPCILSRENRNMVITHDSTLYKTHHKIENMFARLRNWRSIDTRYDRCADIFL